jgi:hypothetical protein
MQSVEIGGIPRMRVSSPSACLRLPELSICLKVAVYLLISLLRFIVNAAANWRQILFFTVSRMGIGANPSES